MKDSRPLECNALAGGYCFGFFLVLEGGEVAVARALTFPGYPLDISRIHKEPHVFRHGILGLKINRR